jgi:aspartyl-tRNA(Asn)/glutamyl-tRNA(Gln) amidotransferase subunit B
MEQGSLRVDANISILPEGAERYGARTEIKNMNSFKFIKKAVEFEAERQAEVLNGGGRVVQETRRYDEASGETFSMRSKEDAQDYRYFPDPDIRPLVITDGDIARVSGGLSEPPQKRLSRYAGYGLSAADADVILENKVVADFFDAAVAAGASPIAAANAVRGELLRCYNASENKDGIDIQTEDFIQALRLAERNEISGGGLKTAIRRMSLEKMTLKEVVERENLIIKEDSALVTAVVKRVTENNPKAVAQYKSGDVKVLSYFMGQCAGELKGGALATPVRDELLRILESD